MMKSLFAIAACVLAGSAYAQPGFEISGDLTKVNGNVVKVFLSYYVNGESKTDSAEVKDGKYAFKGMVPEPVLASLRVRIQDPSTPGLKPFNMRKDGYSLFLENSKIKVASVDSFANSTVTGSKSNDEFLKLKELNKAQEAKMASLNKEYSAYYQAKDEAGMKRLETEFEKLDAEMKANYKTYLKANPNSPIAIYVVGRYAGYDIDAADVEPLFLGLSESTQNSAAGQEMAKKIGTAKKTGIGAMAMDFTQNDTLGKPVSLSSFRGKYVLVDFWASWCGPCRKENPNVVAAFQKYNSKGFDILGVSLDQPNGKERWMKAIYDDKLTWTQVSDLKYWKNEVAVLYGIQAIPQNFLIDPQGKIIGKNLRGDALNAKLAELFN